MTDPGLETPDGPRHTAPDPQTAPPPPIRRTTSPLLVGLLVVVIALCGAGALAVILSPDADDTPAATSATGGPATATTFAAPSAQPATTRPAATATTAAAVVQPEPLPADQVFSGRGDKVVKLTLAEDYVYLATITHTGRSNFAVWTIDAAGEQQDLLVNEIGNYSGVRPVDLNETPVALKIEADGSWKVQVQVAQKAPVWTGKASGKGAAVLRMSERTQGLTVVKITHSGRSNFSVWVYGDSSDLLVNEIGNYSGEVLMPPGMLLVEIDADGAWTLEKVS